MPENRQIHTGEQPKARRRPENVSRNARYGNGTNTRNTTYTGGRPQSAPTGSHTGNRNNAGNTNYRFQAEPGRTTQPRRPATSDRSQTGRRPRLDPKEAKKRQKQKQKSAAKQAKKERYDASVAEYKVRQKDRSLVRTQKKNDKLQRVESAWQKDIVRVYGGVDKVMLGLILTLVCLGTVMVFSASYPSALNEGHDMYYYSKRQIVFVILGLIGMVVISRIPYTVYKTDWVVMTAYVAVCFLLILVLLIGTAEGEAKRWLNLGFCTIQPSEFMKVVLILILAWYVDKWKPQIEARIDRKHTFVYNVVYPCIFVGIACVLILLEKHLSGTLITGAIGLAVMLAGGCHIGWTMSVVAPAGLTAALVFLFTNDYAMKRITSFVDENVNTLSDGYQTIQGIYAIGSGGLFGLGLGHSRQKYSYVAAAHTDFIFSIWCEEMGFIGAVFLVALYLAFVIRGYTIASRAPDTFSSLVAYGISTHVGVQALMNICVVTKLFPNTGVSLPFFSYGGTSLVVLLCEMGILLSISRQYYMKRKDLEELRRSI